MIGSVAKIIALSGGRLRQARSRWAWGPALAWTAGAGRPMPVTADPPTGKDLDQSWNLEMRVCASGYLFRDDRQVALVATELKGPELACCHWSIGLAAGGDRSRVSGAGRGDILPKPHVYRLAVNLLAVEVESIFVDREDVGAFALVRPAGQRIHRRAFIPEWRAPVADEVYGHGSG
jgi:hypothetical protein